MSKFSSSIERLTEMKIDVTPKLSKVRKYITDWLNNYCYFEISDIVEFDRNWLRARPKYLRAEAVSLLFLMMILSPSFFFLKTVLKEKMLKNGYNSI